MCWVLEEGTRSSAWRWPCSCGPSRGFCCAVTSASSWRSCQAQPGMYLQPPTWMHCSTICPQSGSRDWRRLQTWVTHLLKPSKLLPHARDDGSLASRRHSGSGPNGGGGGLCCRCCRRCSCRSSSSPASVGALTGASCGGAPSTPRAPCPSRATQRPRPGAQCTPTTGRRRGRRAQGRRTPTSAPLVPGGFPLDLHPALPMGRRTRRLTALLQDQMTDLLHLNRRRILRLRTTTLCCIQMSLTARLCQNWRRSWTLMG
mmetsp:Transcript_12439/g.35363  ORF Transcript_12439/g.35363 Transcript_12439/m.35363 type:complete len:258 (+) Transcript_12439:686-1459(+)